MDQTELHYVSFDPEETWDEMMDAYIEAGGDVLYPGDEKEILLRAVLAIGTAICAKCDSGLRMDTLTYAQGEYLKEYGKKRFCDYKEAVAATAPIAIAFRATGREKTIPAGTELTADGTVIYLTNEDIVQTGNAETVEATITCQTAGAVGNGLTEGTQLQFVENNDAVLTVTVTEDASGGVDAENQEVYRNRIHVHGLTTNTTGTEQAYESKTLEVSSQIIDARALNDGDGQVGIYTILEDGADQQAIFAAIAQALSPTNQRPLDDEVHVYAAAEVAYSLNVKVWINEYTKLTGDIQKTIDAYQEWQDHRVGRAFDPDRLKGRLFALGVERVEFLSGSGIEGSTAYQAIPARSRCKGTITHEVVTT